MRFDNGAVGKISATDESFMPYQFNIRIFGEDGTIDLNQLYKRSSEERAWKTLAGTIPDNGAVWHHPFTVMIADFVDCIKNDHTPECDFFETIWAHYVCFAAEESARQGGISMNLGPYGN